MARQRPSNSTVHEMADEEPQPDITPMIDVVFLLLIFFMCMKFKSFEKKLDSELPDDGLSRSEIEPVQQLRVRLQLMPGEDDKVMIVPDPQNEYFIAIPWRRGASGKREMFEKLEQQVRRGFNFIGSKIEIAPEDRVPFDYVALTLDALHKAQRDVEKDDRKAISFMASGPQPGSRR